MPILNGNGITEKNIIKNKIKKYDVKVKEVEVITHPQNVNNIVGYKRENIEKLKDFYDVDVVITTMGLTGASTVITSYDIDYQGNLNLLNEAKKSNVKK